MSENVFNKKSREKELNQKLYNCYKHKVETMADLEWNKAIYKAIRIVNDEETSSVNNNSSFKNCLNCTNSNSMEKDDGDLHLVCMIDSDGDYSKAKEVRFGGYCDRFSDYL